MKTKNHDFIAWICPLLKPSVASPNEYIFYEGDEITSIYFITQGYCFYVLPKFLNSKFVKINDGDSFGVLDILAACVEIEDQKS